MELTTSVRVNKTLYKVLRAKAKQDGRTIAYLINLAVRLYINQDDTQRAGAK